MKKDSFADGIRKLNTKGSLVLPARLTKTRAVLLLEFIDQFKHNWYMDHPKGDDREDDMQLACQWILNQINCSIKAYQVCD